MQRLGYILIIMFIFPFLLKGNISDTIPSQKNITLIGYVSDAESGERLAGVTVIETNLKIGVSTNEYGYYSLIFPAGTWNLQLS